MATKRMATIEGSGLSSAYQAPRPRNPLLRLRFHRVAGLAAVTNRELYVTITREDLGHILGAIPASEIPDDMIVHYTRVIRWLTLMGGER